MAVFRRLFFVAVCAGGLAGVWVTGLHQFATVPLILSAERYEAAQRADHVHDSAAWMPTTGSQRVIATAVTDVLTGIAYALILVAIWSWFAMRVDLKRGVVWGLAGFAVVSLAPSLGLSPELPGTQVAALSARQLWWASTVVLSATGLGALVFAKATGIKVLALGALVLPHLIGAPRPTVAANLAPPELIAQFHLAVLGTSAAFWLVLGGLCGWLMGKRRATF
jgi:cobalt transporter subunit CbtA